MYVYIANFQDDDGVQAAAFSWERATARAIADQHGGGFHVVLSCDCVFAPLYGLSYIPLAESIHELLLCQPGALEGVPGKGAQGKPLAIVCMQRRNGDQVDEFLAHFASLQPAATSVLAQSVVMEKTSTDGVHAEKAAKIEVFEMFFP